MRLLLIEDDPMIGSGVQQALQKEGYAVDWLQDGATAQAAIDDYPYELVLLDLGLPSGDGLELLRRLRKQRIPVPVLIMTARDSVADRVKGLDAGADDYLLKPFDLAELSARIRVLLRRNREQADPILRVGDLEIDPATHAVSLAGELVKVSAREFALLQALAESPGRPLSRAQLEEKIYGWDEEVESNAVEVHIHALRRKLGTKRIANLRGVGYYLVDTP